MFTKKLVALGSILFFPSLGTKCFVTFVSQLMKYNSILMMVYVVVQLVEEFETDATKLDSLDIATNNVVSIHPSSAII